MTNDSSEFLQKLTILLQDKKFEESLLIIKEKNNEEKVKEHAWDLLPEVLRWCRDSEDNIHHCHEILMHFAKVANSKEILIGFLENSDDIIDNTYFKSLLMPLQTVLCNLPNKRGKSLEGTLRILHKYVDSLPPPEEHNLEGEERKLMDLDENVCRINDVMRAYLPFFDPFVKEVSLENCRNCEMHYFDRILHQRSILCKYLLELLAYPLVYLDLSYDKKGKSTSRVCSERLINCLTQLQGNFFLLYNLLDDQSEDIIKRNEYSPDLSIGNLAYLVFVENLGIDCIPQVFTHSYNFERHLIYIVALLSRQSNCVVYKGIHLAERLISILEDRTFNHEYLDIPEFSTFLNSLFQVVLYCPIKELHYQARNLFLQYLNKLDSKAVYNLLYSQFCSQRQAKVRGLIINTYKIYMCRSLELNENEFIGKNLIKFLNIATKLPNKVETDLLEYSDIILESINVLRYLTLRKDITKVSQIWSFMKNLEENFLKPLHTALDLSRAHYKLQLSKVKEEKNVPKHDPPITVTVNKETFENIPANDQIKFLNLSLLSFDLIESNLAALEQDIQANKDQDFD
ncbi:glomulin-like [Centruroides sculpturatus]|uniref:glomulin-like n=1 Tax=Centruroides sculpturatus TaxID=218467 RepID=UPI000C6D0C43|nr:glomulin-like [Centruroides sculpturatus]XP_023224080.1 glomulin-like [Centruroides sculpturatus]